MRIFSESPLDRRDHANRLSCHIIHEFRFSRIDFCSAARCRQRAGESGFYDPPRAFTGISRVHSTATVARTGTNSPTMSVESVCVSKRLSASESVSGRKRAGESGSYAPPPALSRESSASTRPPRSREPCPCSAHHANLRLPRIGFRAATQSASVRAKTTSTTLTVISRIHSTATVARTVPSAFIRK